MAGLASRPTTDEQSSQLKPGTRCSRRKGVAGAKLVSSNFERESRAFQSGRVSRAGSGPFVKQSRTRNGLRDSNAVSDDVSVDRELARRSSEELSKAANLCTRGGRVYGGGVVMLEEEVAREEKMGTSEGAQQAHYIGWALAPGRRLGGGCMWM